MPQLSRRGSQREIIESFEDKPFMGKSSSLPSLVSFKAINSDAIEIIHPLEDRSLLGAPNDTHTFYGHVNSSHVSDSQSLEPQEPIDKKRVHLSPVKTKSTKAMREYIKTFKFRLGLKEEQPINKEIRDLNNKMKVWRQKNQQRYQEPIKEMESSNPNPQQNLRQDLKGFFS